MGKGEANEIPALAKGDGAGGWEGATVGENGRVGCFDPNAHGVIDGKQIVAGRWAIGIVVLPLFARCAAIVDEGDILLIGDAVENGSWIVVGGGCGQ